MIPFLNAVTSLRIIFGYLHRSLILQVSAATSYDMSSKLNKYCEIWVMGLQFLLQSLVIAEMRSRISIRLLKSRSSSRMWMPGRTNGQIRWFLFSQRFVMMKQLLCFDAKQSHRTGSYWCVKFRGLIQPHFLPVCKGQKWADVVLPKGDKNIFQPFQLQTFSGVFARRQWSSKWLQFDNLWTREIDE